LVDEREKRIGDITGSIVSTQLENLNAEFGRIVTSNFANDPLSGKGSVVRPPGGRFNIAKTSSYSNYFIGLYLAEDFPTAFAEKYHKDDDQRTDEELRDFSLIPNESFSFNRVSVHLDSYIDLNSNDTLEAFTEVIKDIMVPDYYLGLGKI